MVQNKTELNTSYYLINEKILNLITLVIAVIGLPLLIFSFFLFFDSIYKPVFFLYLVSTTMFWLLFLFRKKIEQKQRMLTVAILLIVVSIPSIYVMGSNGIWGFLLILYSFVISLLYGRKGGLLSVAYSIIYISLFGYFFILNPINITPAIPIIKNEIFILLLFRSMLIVTISLIIVYSVSKFRNYYSEALNNLIKAKQDSEENEAKYKQLSVATFEGIVLHEKGIAFDINQSLEKMFGYSRNEIIGKNVIKEFICKEYHETIYKNIARQYTLPYEIEGIKKDGTRIPLEVEAKYIKKYSGEGNIHVVALRNISQRKKAEKEIKKLSTAVEQSANAIIITNIDGKIEYANHSFTNITGYTAKEVIGTIPRILEKEAHSGKSFAKMQEAMASGKVWKGEFHNKTKSGNLYWEENTIMPIIEGDKKIVNHIIIKEDISLRKKAEEELKKQNEEYASLNEEYKTINEELIVAKEKAEESDKLKTDFINNMSHEIRTPMNGIFGFSNLLSNDELTDKKKQQYISIIQNSGRRLMRIIDDILEISKLGTNKVKIIEQEICLNDLLLEQFSIFDIKANENKIPLYIKKGLPDKESTIFCDEIKLNKILGNLLENALKFTTEGFIEFGYRLKNDKELEIYVKDTGVGINPENQTSIFNRFSQAEKELSQNLGGLGLGLSIAMENAKLLNGSITLKSEKGKGSTFFVAIPYKPVYTNKKPLNKSKKTYTVLVAENEDINYLYIDTLLNESSLNIKVLHAKHGQEAVEMCKGNFEIDLILMDIKMPVMDGLKATKQIKQMNLKAPIIAQTAYSTKKDREDAFLAGCDDFISKPINKKEFDKIIKRFLVKN